jgi:hypothetical protein
MKRIILALLFALGASPALAFTYSFNVANAPAWQSSHSYTHVGHLGDRVLAGPGLTPGGTPAYTNGSALYLLELTTAGTSAGSQPTISSCPSTGITDGGATWKCLVKVDYITLSSPLWDDPVQWQPNVGTCTNDSNPQPGCYWQEQIVVNAGWAWRQCYWDTNVFGVCGHVFNSGSAPFKCVAASSGPGPTTPGSSVADGGCSWVAVAKIPYTSDATHASALPHQLQSLYPTIGDPSVGRGAQIVSNVQMTITTWHGGFATQTYTGGVGDEANPISVNYHSSRVGDNANFCIGTISQTMDTTGCGFGFDNQTVRIVPAAGESFRDNLASSDPLAIDQTKGVTILGVGQDAVFGCDTFVWLDGLQLKSTGGTSPAFGGLEGCHNNSQNATNSILDSDGPTTFGADAYNTSGNNLIINRSNAVGASGSYWKYNGFVYNTTYISLGSGANRTAHISLCGDVQGTSSATKAFNNSLYFGWVNQVAINTPCFATWNTGQTSNNATDLPNSSTNPSFTDPYLSVALTGQVFGGASSLFSQSAAATFVDAATNPRLVAGSPVRGLGVSYVQSAFGFPSMNLNNTKDMFGSTRSPTFDLGPAQFRAGAPGAVVNTISLCSTSGSTVTANTPSPPMFPLEFKKGDIPAGQYPQLQALDGTPWPATFINIRHWSDGTMKMAGVLPGPFPKAVPVACVSANVFNGGSAPAASGLTPTQLYAALIQMNITGQGASFGLTGSWDAKLANDARNVEVVNYGDGGGGRVYRILTHVEQSGTAHGQMEVYWYVQQVLDASGGVAGYRVLGRLTQPWYNHDTPAKDWRGLSAFNIQYGAGPTTITPPFPQGSNPLTITASNWIGSWSWTTTTPASYNDCGGDTQQCMLTGYVFPNGGGSLPTGLSTNTVYCIESFPTGMQFSTCNMGDLPSNVDGGTGTFTFQPMLLLPHFGTLWTAGADGRYAYVPGTAATDAPIIVKGNPTYDQSTHVWPPYNMSLSPPPDPNPSTWSGTGGTLAYNNMSKGPYLKQLNQGGERDSIGVRTTWCARAFYNHSLNDDKTIRSIGLSANNFSINMRDFATRGPVHLGNPANSYTGMPASTATTVQWGGEVLRQSGFTAPAHGLATRYAWTSDFSHMPDIASCAYLMTGEPQYLDLAMEFANHAISGQIPTDRNAIGFHGSDYYGVVTYISGWGMRLQAWSLRALTDADAWWPDSDPAGTQIGAYLHAQQQASTALPVAAIPFQNSYAATNCLWDTATGTNRGQFHQFYMMNVLVNAYNNDEDANALTLMNCQSTFWQHIVSTFGTDYPLYAIGESTYDTNNIGGGLLSVNATWAGGIATLTQTGGDNMFTGETGTPQIAGYTNTPVTLTRTGPTTATFPQVASASPASGSFNIISNPIDSDDYYGGIATDVGAHPIEWLTGSPGTFALGVSDYSVYGGQTPGGQSWNPANGDKFNWVSFVGFNNSKAPGGLQVHQAYYAVNMHAGTICGMSWSSGTETFQTCSAHGMSGTRKVGISGNSAIGSSPAGIGGVNLTCTITDGTHFTCPIAVDPGVASIKGNYNSFNLATTRGGTAVDTTDTSDPSHPGIYDFYSVPANAPIGYWVDYPGPQGYLTSGHGAMNAMLASCVTGMAPVMAKADARWNYYQTYFGYSSLGAYYQAGPKNAFQTTFGGSGCSTPPPSSSAPISAMVH